MATVAAVAAAAAASSATPPHFIMILQDDLGHYDVGWNNPDRVDVTGNLTALAQQGVALSNHYVFYWCSPTRRSFLSGRLPMHHGESLSNYASDDLDLRWNIISQKLKTKGYKNYWFGKGHTGYKSMAHLPVRRGFDNHTGFLIGMQSYTSTDRWQGGMPLHTNEYGTTLCGDAAVAALTAHDAAVPFFLYLPWQAVHSPYDNVPGWPHNGEKPAGTYKGMLWLTDQYVGRLVGLLHQKDMWSNTLIVYSADNGGRGDGINYPYRGEKRTNYEGGMRVAAFVSGGLLPASVRGTTSDVRMHIVDWYPTMCGLAGIPAADGSPQAPKSVPASDPTPVEIRNDGRSSGVDWAPTTDIYGDSSWPDIDGVDVWDMLVNPGGHGRYDAHETIVLSHEVLLRGKYKIMVAQRGPTNQGADGFEAGWRYPNYTWVQPAARTCGEVDGSWQKTKGRFRPCVYDLEADPREERDLSATMPDLRDELYKQLNDSWRTFYVARSPAELLGECDAGCANARWAGMGGVKGHGPACGVPGCPPAPTPAPPPTPAPAPSSACAWVEATGLLGNSLGTRPAATKEACCGLCVATEGCAAADWNNRTQQGVAAVQPMCHLRDCNATACGHSVTWGGMACVPTGPRARAAARR